MPDLQQFSVTPMSKGNMNLPRLRIECRVVEPVINGATLADFTGANAIIFPAVLDTLPPADVEELVRMVAHWIIMKKAGFEQ
jgi:hypothetical protein